MTTNKKLYLVVHEHNHGADTFLVRCSHYPSEKEVIDACNIDYEYEEPITIDCYPEKDIIEIA